MTQAHHIHPLPDPIVIGIAGHAGAGKDTAAAYLVERYGFVQASFADPIRSMALLLLEEAGIDHRWLTERASKEARIPGLGISARALMQTLGTECGRSLHPNIWVRHIALRLGLPGPGPRRTFGPGTPAALATPVHDRIVISDCRFPNEADWINLIGGKVIRLHRRQAGAVRPHVSEAQVMDLHADVDLHNHGEHFAGLHGLLDGAMATWCIGERDSVKVREADPAAHTGFAHF
jgi:hypothetical protein